MDIILIPGLWLDASSWDSVTPHLEEAGHVTHALTLPGMGANDGERTQFTLRDAVRAVVSAIDSVDPAGGKVVLVAHSAAGGVAHAAVDARPDRVARAVYVGGFPTGDGNPIASDFPVVNGEIPLPGWSQFDESDLGGLDDAALAEFRERAIPAPAYVVRDPQRLSDERRYDVPITVVATEFTTEMLRDWIARGLSPVAELPKVRDVTYVDLPTGHWPQLTRPADLAEVILQAVRSRR